jgi:uncharacterized protein with PQ loop repeat
MSSSSEILTKHVAPIIGFVLANFMFFSTLPKILSIRLEKNQTKKTFSHAIDSVKDVKHVPATVFVLMTANCISWMIYACVIKDYWVFMSNVPGVIVATFSMVVSYGRDGLVDRERLIFETVLLVVVFMLCVVGLLVGVALDDYEQRKYASGAFCCLVLTMYYMSPLQQLREVVVERDSRSLYRPMAVAITVNGLSWGVYGIALGDWFLTAPNLFGGVLGIAQCALIVRYPASNASAAAGAGKEEEENAATAGVEDDDDVETTMRANAGSREDLITKE